MLTLLKTWLTNNANNETFGIERMCDLEKSCCPNVLTEFFDFDKIKDWYQGLAKARSFKSVDALYIDEKNASLYFVEMKGWKKFLERPENVCDDKIKATAQSYDLDIKFKHSLSILEGLIHRNDFKPQLNGTQLDDFDKSPKYFILVTDLDLLDLATNPLEKISAAFLMWGHTSSKINLIHHCTDEALSSLKATDYGYTNLQAPKRLHCSEVDVFFNNLL